MKNICFHLKGKMLMTLLMVMSFALPALAQRITVHGTVSDEFGDALIGATVIEKGTSNGTAADIDGRFELSVNPNATLVVSYVGYEPMDVAVNNRTEINIVMKENSTMLNDVVVIGYGTVKKEDATGSVAMVLPDEVEAGISTSAQDLLTGASPGVVVTSSGGSPEGGATIRIRGGASLNASNDPLIVLDGVPLVTGDISGMANPLSMISPDNIESMTILKDASATAIYGSRASNGVIIITTKKGKSGKPQVNFSASARVDTPRRIWDVMNASEYSEVIRQYWGADSKAAAQLGTADTNWQREVLRTTVSQDYNLSVGGTVGFLPYRVSGSYTSNEGILKDSRMQRVTAGFNLNPKFFNGLLQINANVKGYYMRNNWTNEGAIGSALSFNPTVPVRTYDETGLSEYPYFYNGYTTIQGNRHAFNVNASLNPVAMIEDRDNYSDVFRSNGNLQIDYAFHFLPELHANLNLGYDVTKSTSDTRVFANSPTAWKEGPNQNGQGTYNHFYQMYRNTLLDFYLNYKKEFFAIESVLDATAGYSWQRFDNHSRSNGNIIETPGFLNPANNGGQLIEISQDYIDGILANNPNADVKSLNELLAKVGNPAGPIYPSNSGNLMLVSFFGRINYTFKDTYLLTVTLRDDGTSRFSPENRWALFPAVGLGWKINNMPFMEKFRSNMNEFKLRLGWGVTGQQSVGGYFPYMPTYQQSVAGSFYPNIFNGQYVDSDGKLISNTYYPNGYNANLKWEETTTWNVALDMGWWNNRLTATLEWYLRDSKDLLSFVTATPGAFTTNMLDQNIGTLRNIGIEATIGAKPIITDDFVWNTSLNVAWNKNKITKLNNEGTYVTVGGISGGNGNTVQVHQVGYPAFSYLLYEQVYDNDGNPIEGCYVDQDGNGAIDSNDLIIKHSRDPKVTMAWNNTFSYKNWDFGFQLRASIGNYVYNNVLAGNTTKSDTFRNGLSNLINADFLFEGGETTNTYLSDYWLENAGFVRCDNITVGYTWPNLLNNNLRLRLYGAVQNPFVITKYKGLDPEVFSGIDNNVYPRPVSFTIGVIATF
ncbi:MAG: TonB-dependent receptor [Bacteroidales bacterium]|nr:TonB-dependent receptor [Bacteroidales bacterium]MBD5190656.1 TonB-dependent receptor [Bacteroidales bacterium]MBD5208998.1 TonB-dependent receptor [Bacteroidales bacterium]